MEVDGREGKRRRMRDEGWEEEKGWRRRMCVGVVVCFHAPCALCVLCCMCVLFVRVSVSVSVWNDFVILFVFARRSLQAGFN